MNLLNNFINKFKRKNKIFWHLVPEDNFYGKIFYNNTFLRKGFFDTNSKQIEINPRLTNNLQSPYYVFNSKNPKEIVFDDVRRKIDDSLPSRLNTLFVFDDFALAERAMDEWFHQENRSIQKCLIIKGAKIHRADSAWLNKPEVQWLESAEKYWRGEMTSTPFPEIIVHGTLYFPEWRTFPKI